MNLADFLKARSPRQVLAQKSVGVFVGPTLSCVVRCGEVDLSAKASFQLLVGMELGAVVCSDRSSRLVLCA